MCDCISVVALLFLSSRPSVFFFFDEAFANCPLNMFIELGPDHFSMRGGLRGLSMATTHDKPDSLLLEYHASIRLCQLLCRKTRFRDRAFVLHIH
jgi:hypothetical protein